MPKTPSKKLYNLIHTLTGSEKRYFKIFAAKTTAGKANKYLQLFNAIDQQATFDEMALKQRIYHSTELKSRKYSELKAYLYELILKSLQAYDERTSINYKLKGMLNNVQVLAKRALYGDCKEILVKAKKIAYQYEQFLVVLEVVAWEKKIAYAESNIAFLDGALERINQEEKNCLQQIKSKLDYQDIYFQLLINSKKEATLRSEQKRIWLEQFFQNPLLKPNIELDNYETKLLYHRIYGYYYFSTGDIPNFYLENKALIDLMENHSIQLKEDPSEYISVVNNQIYCCGSMRKIEELNFYLEKLKNIPPITEDDAFKIFIQYYMNKLIYCIEVGDFQQGIQVIQEREVRKKAFKKRLFKANFYLSYTYIYFGMGIYDEALHWLNKVLDLPKSIVRQDLQSVARIINLIIHYEMGNVLLLESLLRSTYRFLRKRNRMYETERRILKFIRKSRNIYTKQELKAAFINLKEDCLVLAQKDSEKPIFGYFNFIAWLESKIQNKDFSTVVQERYRTKNAKTLE